MKGFMQGVRENTHPSIHRGILQLTPLRAVVTAGGSVTVGNQHA